MNIRGGIVRGGVLAVCRCAFALHREVVMSFATQKRRDEYLGKKREVPEDVESTPEPCDDLEFAEWRSAVTGAYQLLADCTKAISEVRLVLPEKRLVIGFASFGSVVGDGAAICVSKGDAKPDVLLTVEWIDKLAFDREPLPQIMTPGEMRALARVQERLNNWKLGNGRFPTQADADRDGKALVTDIEVQARKTRPPGESRMTKVLFSDVPVGEIFYCWGDLLINYGGLKWCKCRKTGDDMAKELDGVSFYVSEGSEVHVPDETATAGRARGETAE